jgi:hypothetical protein
MQSLKDTYKRIKHSSSSNNNNNSTTITLPQELHANILVIGDQHSKKVDIVRSFCTPDEPYAHRHSMSRYSFMLSFTMIEPCVDYLTLKNSISNADALIYMFNIYSDCHWSDFAAFIEKVIVENGLNRIPCFLIGTKRNQSLDSQLSEKLLVSTADVLHYVDENSIWEAYLETDYGVYCNTELHDEARITIEPLLRSLLRRDCERRKTQSHYLSSPKRV